MTLLFLLLFPAQQEMVHYALKYETASPSVVRVVLTLPDSTAGPLSLIMPRAVPMGYGEAPYDRYLEDIRAIVRAGDASPVSRQAEGPRWTLPAGTRRVEYRVNLERMERETLSASDTSKVRPDYVGLLGYSVFAYVEGLDERLIVLDVEAPASWPVLSTLAPSEPAPRGGAKAQAPNFYALADSQIVMGPRLSLRRLSGTVPLFTAIYAEGDVDEAVVGRVALEALEKTIAYFGGAPFPQYTVHQEYLKPASPQHRYGFSMEHLDSGTFYLAADQGLTARSTEADLARTRYNFAHHMAHAWIPKRSYGKGYYPFTWELAPVLDSIWFSEGFAQYVAIEALAAGLPPADAAAYRQGMLDRRFKNALAEAPAFIRRMSLVELSQVASTRYSEDFRTGRNVFSRGGLMAAEIDEQIRRVSRGEKSLRDALRYLVAWTGKSKRAFRIDELPVLFSMATGVDTRDTFERWMKPPDP